MYLRGSKWSMARRRRPSNPIRVVGLLLLVGLALYLNKVVVPTVRLPGEPTPTATRDPESYVSEAQQLFDQGKLTQSISSYQDAIRAKPTDPATYIAMARVMVFAGQYAQAQQAAENALLLNPDNSMANAVRGWSLYFQNDYDNAKAALDKAIELDPNNAMAHAYNAELLADMAFAPGGDYALLDTATKESRDAMDLAPNTLEAHRARGYVLEVTGNFDEAAQEYKAALAINNNIADVHLSLGRVYRAQGAYPEAVTEFTTAFALNPNDPLPNLYISRVKAAEGDYAQAIQYAEQSVTTDPTYTLLRGNLGVLYFRNFQYDDAFRQLSIVVHGGTTDDGKPIEAMDLTNDPRVAEYYATFGQTLQHLGRCGEAISVFQQVLTVVAEDQLSYQNAQDGLAKCLADAGTPGATGAPTAATTEAPVAAPTATP
jgi:tetratricopeptide (TPR) repeat protein